MKEQLKYIGKIKNITHSDIYYWTLVVLAISLTLSPFATSLCQFVLIINWITEGITRGDFAVKIKRLKQNKPLLIFLTVFIIHVMGVFFTSDMHYWFRDVKIKLPLFILPVIIGSIEPIGTELYKRIIRLFIWSNLIASAFSMLLMLNLFGFQYNDVRYTSIIISHIRFALYIVTGTIFLLDDLLTNNLNFYKSQKWINSLLVAWFILYLILLRSLTGIFSLFILTLLYSAFMRKHVMNKGFKVFVAGGIVTAIAVLIMTGIAISKFSNIRIPEKDELERYTANGNPYAHNLENKFAENGNLIYIYISKDELKNEWNKRSDIDFYGTDQRGQVLRLTLIRYLTSLGLRKDSIGVSKLSRQDISAIEFGYANHIYTQPLNFYSRIYQTIWEIDQYIKGGNPTNHSVTQRFEYLRAAFHILKKSPFTGVGNGNLKREYQQAYNEIDTKLSVDRQLRAHNQYVTFLISFGVIIGSYIIFALFYPFIQRASQLTIPELLYYVLAFISMLTEDTLETQAGVMFFIFFYVLFLSRSPLEYSISNKS